MKFSKKEGFTLIEILIASVIISAAVLAIIGTLANTVVLSEINRDKTLAVIHGQYILEMLKDESFTSLENDINNGDFDFSMSELSATPFGFTVLRNETIDTQVVTSGDPLRLSVTISWKDRGNNPRSLTFETLRAG